MIETFHASLVEKLVTIFKRLDGIEETVKWFNRTSLATLGTGMLGVIETVISWLIKN
ncbi:hypothetical protein [Sporosarcina sp. NCCP-2716]|uniref:hypothetical protein n=1 Tax=Sporosarcina sp. NCCP-2716 TaxID=2943679 RepID=UPI002040632B|nr:hypothetical protein [Sporosarcina sp. NCCP-2716]